jgi:antiviral helicase SLH1
MSSSISSLFTSGIYKNNVDNSIQNEMNEKLRTAFYTGTKSVQLPNVYTTRKAQMISIGGKLSLPAGTTHNDVYSHEEFIIPYPKDHSNLTERIKTINVSDMDDFLKKGYSGYNQLNKMQSAVFYTAHYSNENMLVCAPTGKTICIGIINEI